MGSDAAGVIVFDPGLDCAWGCREGETSNPNVCREANWVKLGLALLVNKVLKQAVAHAPFTTCLSTALS
jgi:hypothetical protein